MVWKRRKCSHKKEESKEIKMKEVNKEEEEKLIDREVEKRWKGEEGYNYEGRRWWSSKKDRGEGKVEKE